MKLTFMGAVSVPSTSNKQIILSLCNIILDFEISLTAATEDLQTLDVSL
jgi:hypothetical protein